MMIRESNCASAIEIETTPVEEIASAVEASFAAGDDVTARALELAASADDISEDVDAPMEEDAASEIETAEEISLKNGVYHEIKRKLGERFQITPHEIAFIHEADTPAKKAMLFKAVNAGHVRVLIGSTSKLGTGVNVQKRLVALHHVDEPWKPAELEQREGRILRQGNIYPEVFIFHYVTERSFDGYMLQTLESKARFISQIMAGEVTARTAEDVGDMVLTVAQVKAIASGNPLVQRRIELEVKLVKLDRLRAAYYNNRARMRADMEELPQTILAQEAEIAGHERSIGARQLPREDTFHMTLKKRLGAAEEIAFDKRERAGAHLRYLADLLIELSRRNAAGGRGSLTEEVGSYCGFKVYIEVSGNSRLAGVSSLFNFRSEIHLRAPESETHYIASIGESNVGIIQSVDYQLRHIEDRLEQARAGIECLRARFVSMQAEVNKPWTHAAEYRRLRKEYDATGAALQAEGVEIENNTTFGAPDEDAVETEISEDAGEAAEQGGSSVDELGGRSNPFTGLEDWAIAVVEPLTDDHDGERVLSRCDNSALSFDFGGADEVVNESEEADIFLTPACDDQESIDLANVTSRADETDSQVARDGASDSNNCFRKNGARAEELHKTSANNRLKSGKRAHKKNSRPSCVSDKQSSLWS
jgi:hypothetical protein